MIRMPWGRHRGLPLDQVPTSYLAWVLESADAPGAMLVRAIKGELARRLDVAADAPPPRPAASSARVTIPVPLRDTIDAMLARGFRALAHEQHPDHGGSSDAMRTTLEARAWLTQVLQR